jgi:hypothetical protein
MNKTIGCNKCGKAVSQEISVPNDFVIRGWIECPECFLSRPITSDMIYNLLTARLLTNKEFDNPNEKHRLKVVDSLTRELVSLIENKRFL